MPDTLMKFRIESDAVVDAARELSTLAEALRSRHGDAFRALLRRIEAIEAAKFEPVIRTTDDGAIILTPPAEWTAILAEARKHGVL